MVTIFCAGCAGDVLLGAVHRGSWVYCGIHCAQNPGASLVNIPRQPSRPLIEGRPITGAELREAHHPWRGDHAAQSV